MNNFRTLRGLGVSGEADGHTLLLGNQALLNEQQVVTTAMDAEISAQASQGATPVLLAIDGKLRRCWRSAIRCAATASQRFSACTAPGIVW